MHILNWCVSGLVNSILLSQYPFHPDLWLIVESRWTWSFFAPLSACCTSLGSNVVSLSLYSGEKLMNSERNIQGVSLGFCKWWDWCWGQFHFNSVNVVLSLFPEFISFKCNGIQLWWDWLQNGWD
jgi:hypothetical protein